MIEYPKIETLFKRDMEGSKQMIDGAYRDPTVEYLKDCQWEFTEKIDGTNIGIVWDGYRVSFQGRTERTQIPAHLVNKLNELFGSVESEELFEQKFGDTEVILFGEGYGTKIQAVSSLYRSDVSFILFDVYIPAQNLWLTREAVNDIAKAFGIDAVPVIFSGTLDEGVAYVRKGHTSTIGAAPMEGLVGRPVAELRDRRGKRIMVKIKARDFK